MGTTRLRIYNNASIILGEGRIETLADDSALRRRLDRVWDDVPLVDFCLEQGFWRFAKRSAKLEYTNTISSEDFGGYKYGFELPVDAVGFNNIKVCSDPYFECAIRDFSPERNYIFCDYEIIYVQYVSNDEYYGGDLSLWPPSFADYVAHEQAFRTAKRTMESNGDEEITKAKRDNALLIAKNKDALRDSSKEIPNGKWVNRRNRRRNGEYS